jgi:hypothetical protein
MLLDSRDAGAGFITGALAFAFHSPLASLPKTGCVCSKHNFCTLRKSLRNLTLRKKSIQNLRLSCAKSSFPLHHQ